MKSIKFDDPRMRKIHTLLINFRFFKILSKFKCLDHSESRPGNKCVKVYTERQRETERQIETEREWGVLSVFGHKRK